MKRDVPKLLGIPITSRKKIKEIIKLLEDEYGPRAWKPRNDPMTELVETVLSQHTSDLNAHRAFRQLMDAFGSWEGLAQGDVSQIAEAIHSGGLARQKAPRIKGILLRILEERGGFDLGFLAHLPLEESLKWLTALPGVGPKTARCVLLFALGRPVIPVDTHVHRVARRLGLIDHKVSAVEAHRLLEAMVLPQDAYRFHVYLIEHGRQICKAPRPRCHQCPLAMGCPTFMAT